MVAPVDPCPRYSSIETRRFVPEMVNACALKFPVLGPVAPMVVASQSLVPAISVASNVLRPVEKNITLVSLLLLKVRPFRVHTGVHGPLSVRGQVVRS